MVGVKKIEEKTGPQGEKSMEEGLKSTRALVQSFLQTLKGFRLYEANHPILNKFLERLVKDFEHYFQEYSSFALQVGEYRLYYRGKVVYESQDVKESLAFIFFKDGIRELRFYRGLDSREILDFLNIVRKSDLVNRMEDDLVTLMWEKDFSHISFTTIEEFLEKGSVAVPASEKELQDGLEFKGTETEWLFGPPEEPKPEGLEVITDEGLKEALSPLPGQSLVQACQLTPEEIDKITQEIEREQQSDYLLTLVHHLIEILLHLGEDMDAYENMISYFERLLDSLLDQGEVGKAVAILRKLRETMESMVLKDKQIFAIRRILEASSRPRTVELLGRIIQENGEGDPESILQYFQFLTSQAVHPLCLLLGQIDSPKWRKALSDQLARLCAQDIHPLTKFLSDPNPVLVCNILSILGKIGHASTAKHLGGLVSHEDPKVRAEALQILPRFGDRGRDLLQRFLKDPEMEIRAKASVLLARAAKDQALRPLADIVLSDDFYKREYEEKFAFFRALGETGAKEAIPILKKIAGKRGWFKGAKWEEMRACASKTLRLMGVVK